MMVSGHHICNKYFMPRPNETPLDVSAIITSKTDQTNMNQGCHTRIAVSRIAHIQFSPFSPTIKAKFPLHLTEFSHFFP